MLLDKIAKLENELLFYKAVHEDFTVKGMPIQRIRTDYIYSEFCRRHPEITVNRQAFGRVLCEEYGLKSVQGRLDGKRGYFYECA